MSRFVFATSEEGWCGLYVDGVLVGEGHSLRVEDTVDLVLEVLGHSASDGRYLDGRANEWLCENGLLPRTLAELDQRIEECEAPTGSSPA